MYALLFSLKLDMSYYFWVSKNWAFQHSVFINYQRTHRGKKNPLPYEKRQWKCTSQYDIKLSCIKSQGRCWTLVAYSLTRTAWTHVWVSGQGGYKDKVTALPCATGFSNKTQKSHNQVVLLFLTVRGTNCRILGLYTSRPWMGKQ